MAAASRCCRSSARERQRVRALAQLVACDIHPLNNLRVLQYFDRTWGVPQPERDEWVKHWIREGFAAFEALVADNGAILAALPWRPRHDDLEGIVKDALAWERKLAERGLQSQGNTQSNDGAPVVPVLSDGQRRMWFVQTAEPAGALLNVCVSFAITGELDHQRLRAAVNAVAGRHAVLRTTYRADATGEPGLTVHDKLAPGWSTHDLSEPSEASRALRRGPL